MERSVLKLDDHQTTALRDAGVVLCYLHGSVALGTAHKNSDADVAVLFERAPKDPIGATADIIETLHGLVPSRELDVAILNEASPLLKQIVASTGMLLYERSHDDRLRFELRTMHEYEYAKHFVRLGREALHEHLSA